MTVSTKILVVSEAKNRDKIEITLRIAVAKKVILTRLGSVKVKRTELSRRKVLENKEKRLVRVIKRKNLKVKRKKANYKLVNSIIRKR